MKYFHNTSTAFPGYNLSFQQLLDQVGGRGVQTDIFLEGLGFAIESIGTDWLGGDKVQEAMNRLALQGKGRIPSNRTVFFTALSDEAQNVSWVDASKFVAVESAKEIGGGLVQVGDTLLTTIKGLGFFFPIVVIGGVLFIAVSKIKKVAK